MTDYIELDNGIEVPRRMVTDLMAARQRGDHQEVMEQVQSIERMIEDLNDRVISGQQEDIQLDLTPQARQQNLRRARRLRKKNPLAKHAANLVRRYTFGDGVNWRASDEENIAPLIKDFWDDVDNRIEVTSHRAMADRCDELWTEGNLFFALFSGEDGRVKVRRLPYEEIIDVVCHPHDERKPVYYRRQRQQRKYNYATGTYDTFGQPQFTYVPAWNNYNVENDLLQIEDFRRNRDLVDDSMRIFHVAVNKIGKWGESELYSSMDWIKSYGQFVEDRITINRAAAAIAWQRKVKGASGKDITDAVSRGIAGKTFDYGGTPITLPPTSGSMVTSSENVEYKWTRGDTGAAAAVDDGRSILMIAGAGFGLPIHWMGEGGDANLATATAMNFPVFRMFLEWQMIWNDIFQFLFEYRIARAIETGNIPGCDFEDLQIELEGMGPQVVERRYLIPEAVDTFIDVDFPPLVSTDAETMVNALVASFTTFGAQGGEEAVKDYASMALVALGVNNVDEMIKRHYQDGIQPLTPPAGEFNPAAAAESGKRMISQLRNFSQVLEGSGSRNGHSQ